MRSTLSVLVLSTLLILTGCGKPEPAPPASKPVTVAAKPKLATPKPAKPADQKVHDAAREAMAAYVAPYPDRTELFVPPKEAPKSASVTTEGNVQLRGLVNVDQPQAILDVEGAIALIPVGAEKFGVKVVSIDDRSVTLQRGGTQWTASLE
ncbi:hypothetical protein [Aeoliella sp. SH292]|uniref:hypothetical protein n=1 Tax=Aeoliella sp. SH292 TaxID=3454464 RepID=UPI003F98ADAB